MHVVLLVAFGLIGLTAFVLIARMINAGGRTFDGARIFIWCWLAASLLNAAVGVFAAKIPLLNEAAAFVPIFGIPAAAAWYVSQRFRTKAARADDGFP
jgi:hypothetical protein